MPVATNIFTILNMRGAVDAPLTSTDVDMNFLKLYKVLDYLVNQLNVDMSMFAEPTEDDLQNYIMDSQIPADEPLG